METNGGLQIIDQFGYNMSDNDSSGTTVELYDAYRDRLLVKIMNINNLMSAAIADPAAAVPTPMMST